MKQDIMKRKIAKRIMAGMLVATLSVLPCMFGYADDAQGVEISVENITENTNENTDVPESAQTDAEKYEANQNIEVMNVSVDPVQEFVRRLYENILNRPADDAGLQAWTNVLKSGTEQGAKVAQGFIDSTEFKSRALNDEEYLKILYRTFFDREPDSVGLEAWLRVLDSGLSRMHVFNGFADSAEFQEICSRYGISSGSGVWIGEADPNPNNSSSGNGNTSSGGSYENSGSSGGNNNQQTISGTVYYTPSGSKYHSTSQCVSLKRSRHIYSTTLSKARAMGLTPCRNCYH